MAAAALSQEGISYEVRAVTVEGDEIVLSCGFSSRDAALDWKVKRAMSYRRLWVSPVVIKNSMPRLRLRD
jgi:hypothetical protein